MLCVSHTKLFWSLMSNVLTIEDIKKSKIAFNCNRDHLIRNDFEIPRELACMDKYCEDIPSDEIFDFWFEFSLAIQYLDKQDCIYWNCGPASDIIDVACISGISVHYRILWTPEYWNSIFSPSDVVWSDKACDVVKTLYPEVEFPEKN